MSQCLHSKTSNICDMHYIQKICIPKCLFSKVPLTLLFKFFTTVLLSPVTHPPAAQIPPASLEGVLCSALMQSFYECVHFSLYHARAHGCTATCVSTWAFGYTSCHWFHAILPINKWWRQRACRCSNMPTKAVKKKTASWSTWMQTPQNFRLFVFRLFFQTLWIHAVCFGE